MVGEEPWKEKSDTQKLQRSDVDNYVSVKGVSLMNPYELNQRLTQLNQNLSHMSHEERRRFVSTIAASESSKNRLQDNVSTSAASDKVIDETLDQFDNLLLG